MKHFLYLVLVFFFQLNIYSQEIKVTASNKSLSKVLIELRDKYDIGFSFNDDELSKIDVNVSKTFKNIDETLTFLLKSLPFEYEIVSGVYVIYPKKVEIKAAPSKPKVYRIAGRIMESKTNELLPFSNIIINSTGIISDQNGNFLYSSTLDSVFRIKISHLGYLITDTLLYAANKNVNIYLTPSDQVLNEIIVSDNLIENFSNTGNEAATIKLNHKVTKYLPGSSDNSVYNLLRLQPGILASGEQSSDLIIWGSYAGQSRVIFDGFTVFGLKNFNDNISAINPLITKNIQLRKAGYDASYGDCVGGIVDISGKDGNTQKPHFSLGINNFTLNSLVEIPILQKSSLQIAYRQTYYNLYKDGYNLFPNQDSIRNINLADIYIYPDYNFRDFNIKYTIKNSSNMFYISILNGKDDFDYSFNKTIDFRNVSKSTSEKNHQLGASVFIERKINSKLNTSLTVSHSGLATNVSDKYDIYSTITSQLVKQKEFDTNNEIWETKAKFQTSYQTKKWHTFETTLQAINNKSIINDDSAGVYVSGLENNHSYYTVGIKDVINLHNKNLDLGFRASYLPYIDKLYIEPRISYNQSLSEQFNFNIAWGLYNQFLVKSSIIDEYGNYRYVWAIADDVDVPVLKANHFVGGFSYHKNNFSINVDGFYKSTQGLTRYIRILTLGYQGIAQGDGRSYGFDFYTKYNFGGHTFWLSYTLSKSEEHFSYFRNEDYLYAPQDQRHELKVATIINLSPIFLSANYVYGSGFLEYPYRQVSSSKRIPYNRLDIAATYKFLKNKNIGECGISILNVLNTENRKYTNFERIPLSQISSVSTYFEAVPFTPTIFLKLNF
ncbi:MAG: TonB-dependent receptor [Bacteroidales bacterium]|nr:TonB-dependent receptor [Bacteroidales bacterium]